MNTIDEILRNARRNHPDLWKRTDDIARIIDPAAFAGDWICIDEDARDVIQAKKNYLQAIAVSKAQSVLEYLGVNTSVDWLEIMDELIGVNRP